MWGGKSVVSEIPTRRGIMASVPLLAKVLCLLPLIKGTSSLDYAETTYYQRVGRSQEQKLGCYAATATITDSGISSFPSYTSRVSLDFVETGNFFFPEEESTTIFHSLVPQNSPVTFVTNSTTNSQRHDKEDQFVSVVTLLC